MSNGGFGRMELEDEVRRVADPILVIAGEHDRVTVPEAGYAIAEAAPESDFVLIRDAGHMAFAEKPKAVRRAIGSVLRPLPGLSGSASVS